MIDLTASTVEPYLRARGVVPDGAFATVEELGWGISNLVCRIVWDDTAIVVKHSLPQLRVADEWLFDRSRIVVEWECMRYLAGILPAGAVPGVVFTDPDSYTFGMSHAPAGGVLWKQLLLDGVVDPQPADRAGHLLRQIHRTSADDSAARERFADNTVLLQGRVDPYHRTAARANPDVAMCIGYEIDRLLATRQALVLGDYSPKNIVVYPDQILILDFEVAHWGDPAFDIAFLLTHLILKAVYRAPQAHDYLDAAHAFLAAYGPLPEGVVPEVGCLLLARLDGKSKVEYLTDDASRALARTVAKDVLTSGHTQVDAILDAVADRLVPA